MSCLGPSTPCLRPWTLFVPSSFESFSQGTFTQDSLAADSTSFPRRHPYQFQQWEWQQETSYAAASSPSDAQSICQNRGPIDDVNTWILNSSSKAQDKGLPEAIISRILMFIWSFGPLQILIPFPRKHPGLPQAVVATRAALKRASGRPGCRRATLYSSRTKAPNSSNKKVSAWGEANRRSRGA